MMDADGITVVAIVMNPFSLRSVSMDHAHSDFIPSSAPTHSHTETHTHIYIYDQTHEQQTHILTYVCIQSRPINP